MIPLVAILRYTNSMYDLNSLQDSLTSGVTDSVKSGFQDQLGKIMAWIVVPSVVLTLLIILLYVLHALRRRKVEKAIFEIRDMLRDAKLSQVLPAKTLPPIEPPQPAPGEPVPISEEK